MELLIEALCDLVIEGTIGLTKSRKVPMPIRIICAVFLFLVFATVIFLIGFIGVSVLREKLWGGILILLFDAFLAALCIFRFMRMVRNRTI
ncbi:MAG: hypothetical protein J6040_08750 [Clostridiales bacterium]|nr:hypothetical protein [Clostridiales bacterium]